MVCALDGFAFQYRKASTFRTRFSLSQSAKSQQAGHLLIGRATCASPSSLKVGQACRRIDGQHSEIRLALSGCVEEQGVGYLVHRKVSILPRYVVDGRERERQIAGKHLEGEVRSK